MNFSTHLQSHGHSFEKPAATVHASHSLLGFFAKVVSEDLPDFGGRFALDLSCDLHASEVWKTFYVQVVGSKNDIEDGSLTLSIGAEKILHTLSICGICLVDAFKNIHGSDRFLDLCGFSSLFSEPSNVVDGVRKGCCRHNFIFLDWDFTRDSVSNEKCLYGFHLAGSFACKRKRGVFRGFFIPLSQLECYLLTH